jgi:hypothetical protein
MARHRLATSAAVTLDRIRARFARLFDRERAVISARELEADQRSDRAIRITAGALSLVLVVAIGLTMHLLRSGWRGRAN